MTTEKLRAWWGYSGNKVLDFMEARNAFEAGWDAAMRFQNSQRDETNAMLASALAVIYARRS